MSRVSHGSVGIFAAADMPFDGQTGVSARHRLTSLAVVGILAGPVFVAVLILFPVVIIGLSVVLDNTIVLFLGATVLLIHGFAAHSLLKVREIVRTRRNAVALTSNDAPELFSLLAHYCGELDISRIKRVLVNTSLNASVTQVPRCFGLAGHRHVLTIGLPLLQSVSRDELAAILAHELAHCRRADGQQHTLVHRVRLQWQRLERASKAGHFLGATALNRLARWYLSRLERQAGQTLRMGELEADAVAASLTNPEVLAHALVRTHVAQAKLRDAWDGYWLQNVHVAQPVEGPWSSFSRVLCSVMSDTTFAPSDGFFGCHSQTDEGWHPTLAARLSRLSLPDGWVGRMETVVAPSAITILGEVRASVTRHFDRAWWRENRQRWVTFYAGVGEQRQRLQDLDVAAARDALSLETALERASRAEYLLGCDAALERFRWCVRRYPLSPLAYFKLGDLMLRCGDNAGEAFLAHAQTLGHDADGACVS